MLLSLCVVCVFPFARSLRFLFVCFVLFQFVHFRIILFYYFLDVSVF